MSASIPRIYPLTDIPLAGMSHRDQVAKLIDGGASLIQLREKKLSPREFYAQAREAVSFARRAGTRVVINDRVDLALALGADGVHLGQDDIPPELARRLLGPEAIIGFSTHTLDQAKGAINLPIDYLAIGPVFPTGTKTDTAAEVGLAGVKAVKNIARNLPVVAIGGISEARIPEVLAAGADSVALISELFRDPAGISSHLRYLIQLAG